MFQKHRWRILLLLILAAEGGFLFLARDRIPAAARFALPKAMEVRTDQLQLRLADSPLIRFLNGLPPDGRYTANVHIEDLCDGILSLDTAAKQLLADGQVYMEEKTYSGTVYADRECLAFNPDASSAFYGIHYSTFSQDLRNAGFLSLLLDENTQLQLEEGIGKLRDSKFWSLSPIQLPTLPEDDRLFWGFLTLPCQIQRTTVLVQGEAVECRELFYILTPENTQGLAEQEIRAHFYLAQKQLVKLQLQTMEKDTLCTLLADFGRDPTADPIQISVTKAQNGQLHTASVTFRTASNDPNAEIWEIHSDSFGNFKLFVSSKTEEITISQDNKNIFTFKQHRSTEGLLITFSDCSGLLGYPPGLPGTILIAQGGPIEKPSYKTVDQLSPEDLLLLIREFGLPGSE